MRGLFILILGIGLYLNVHSQVKDSVPAEPKGPWSTGGRVGLIYSEAGLFNWAAGGLSSMTLITDLNVFGNRKTDKNSWENSADLAYGFIRNNFIFDPQAPIVKAEDKINVNSKYNQKAFSEKFFYSFLFNFRSQFAYGYPTPGDSVYISKSLAPGYIVIAAGLEYKPNKSLNFFLSPVSGKITMVLDDSLAAAGAFGVNSKDLNGDFRPGSKENMRYEFGATARIEYKKDIMENVNLESKAEFFSNYIDRPQNIDIRWSNAIIAKINAHLTANLTTDLIYDNDVIIPIINNKGEPEYYKDGAGSLILDASGNPIQRRGPRVQFKEIFGLGISYKF